MLSERCLLTHKTEKKCVWSNKKSSITQKLASTSDHFSKRYRIFLRIIFLNFEFTCSACGHLIFFLANGFFLFLKNRRQLQAIFLKDAAHFCVITVGYSEIRVNFENIPER